MSNSLPSTWAIVSLLDVAPLVPTGVPNFTGEVEYYSTGSVQEDGLSSEGRYTFESRPSRANRWTKPGDVLQARMQGTSKPLLVNASIADKLFSTGFIQLRPDPRFCNPGFLRHYIASKVFLDDRDSLATGSTQIALTDAGVRELEIPLAPLNEQRRIAAKLDILLGKVDECQKRLAKISMILNRFRQAVLAAACSGRLTADWREQGQRVTPVDYSIQNILQQREAEWIKNSRSSGKYKPPQDVKTNELQELPEGWKYISSDALFSFVTSGSRGWAKYYANSGPIFVRVGNLDHDTISLDVRNVQHVNPPAGQEKERTRIQLGDILISITADVGMIALIQDEIGEAYINQHVAIARPLRNILKPYLAWYLASREGGQAQFQGLQRGATKVGLGLDDIGSVAIPFPPIEEQQEIVRRVESMFKLADSVGKRVAAATARAEKLSQSILAKAFRGELVPTEAELARREGRSYKSASDLLARIKSDRESKQASQKVRRNRNL